MLALEFRYYERNRLKYQTMKSVLPCEAGERRFCRKCWFSRIWFIVHEAGEVWTFGERYMKPSPSPIWGRWSRVAFRRSVDGRG